ncbi:MAG: Ppx/GppA phosphatase family protein [Clostridia bacterium]|nr:Ppx/GppA phosphatase family protein [Clostridia bacterium]
MRMATMDVGTNSTRLLVTEIREGQSPALLYQTLCTTRIGEGMEQNGGILTPAAIKRTVEALQQFSAIAAEFSVEKLAVVATAAVREAQNGSELVKLAWEKAGLEVRIIPGEEEARLSYLGVIKGLPEAPVDAVVIDVGGGSTEFIWPSGAGRMEVASVPLGAVRATEAGLNEEQILRRLDAVLTRVTKVRPRYLIGVGGTATTLAAMNLRLELYDPIRVHGCRLKKTDINSWYRRLSEASPEQRKTIPGLQSQRADIIVAGVAIVKTVLEKLDLDELTVSETDLLWGLIYEEG